MGVASVIGTVFFMVVFLLAIGSMAYASGLQAQASEAELQAQSAASRHGEETLSFTAAPSGVEALNDGPATLAVDYVVLKFPNGTVYPIPASAEVPSGGTLSVGALVPGTLCSPGTATCLSKYDQIAAGNPYGSSVGVVTSLGNIFWYTDSPQSRPGAVLAAWVSADVTTTGYDVYGSTTLEVHLEANTTYAIAAYIAIEPTYGTERYNFEIHSLPPGATLIIACAPMSYPEGGGNQPTDCVTSTETPVARVNTLGFGVAPPVFETPGLFGMVKVGGSGGTFQIDFACVANCGAVTVKAGSYMLAAPVS
jgi:hypothetical protein